jgi:hypothetical protein
MSTPRLEVSPSLIPRFEEHLAHYVPNEDDEAVWDKLDKLNKFAENPNFVTGNKSGIEQIAAHSDQLTDRSRALLKALGFVTKVTVPL